MKPLCSVVALGLAVGLVAAPAGAQGTGKASKPIKCDVCGGKMNLTARKTKANTQAVTVNGKTMYCCPCDMSKSKIDGLKVPPPK